MATTSASIALEDFVPDQGDRTVVASPNNDNESNAYKCLLVFAGFMAIFQVNGINSSYGVFQQYYLSNNSFSPLICRQQRSHLLEHWVRTKQNLLICRQGFGLSWALGVFISPLMAKLKNFRIIFCAGAILMSSGLVLASFSTTVIATRTYCNANGSSHTCI